MSVALDAVDLSAATVGTVGLVDWTGVIQAGAPGGVRAGRPHLRVFNESGCGLRIVFATGTSDRVPAGGWSVYQLSNDNRFTYTVEYVLPGAPVSLLLCTLYEPGEAVPPAPVLGNSPIGIGGTVSTTTGSVLKNDNNPPATQFIEATPSDQAGSAISVNNDGSLLWRLLSANAWRTALNFIRGNTGAGKASLQIGDSADATITTVYGSIQGGQPASVGLLTATEISSDAGKVTTDGAGNLGVTSVATVGRIISDAGKVETDGAGGLTTQNLIVAGIIQANATSSVVIGATVAGAVGMELGSQGTVGPAFIDLHSSGSANDYDVRIIASGGINGTPGVGTLNLHGRSIQKDIPDSGFGTMRAVQEFIGTTDPATYATVNEGDSWDAV